MTEYTQDSFLSDDSDAGAPEDVPDPGTCDVGDAGDVVDASEFVEGEPSAGSESTEDTTGSGDEEDAFGVLGGPRVGTGPDWLDMSAPTVLPLNRPRVPRPALVPMWLPISIAATLAFVVLVVVLVVSLNQGALASVPQVVGIDVKVANQSVVSAGFKLMVSQRRFSSQPAGTVLSQDPVPDSKLKRGETVKVVVSAGSEEFTMPDVVGKGVLLARGVLEGKGLDVRVDPQPSDQPSDTVLATNPSAGQTMHTGDIVHLTVAAQGPSARVLLPSDMTGVVVVIDAQPVGAGQNDVPVDVARRLRALIEASKGTVVDTSLLAEIGSAVSPPIRAQRAAVSSATVAVGIRVVASGPSGIIVFTPAATLPQTLISGRLASQITTQFAEQGLKTQQAATAADDVFGLLVTPWVRMQLGSFGSKDDVAQFADPSWKDRVARALYRAVAEQYGSKPQTDTSASTPTTP